MNQFNDETARKTLVFESTLTMLYEVCSINTRTKIITEKRLSVMLLYRNKLEIMTVISVYNNNRYLESVVDNTN